MLSDRLVCVSAHVRVRPAFLTSRVIVCTAPQGQNCKKIMRKLVNDKPTRQSFFEDRNVSTRTEKCYKKILKLHKKTYNQCWVILLDSFLIKNYTLEVTFNVPVQPKFNSRLRHWANKCFLGGKSVGDHLLAGALAAPTGRSSCSGCRGVISGRNAPEAGEK